MPDEQGPSMEVRAFIAVVLSLAVMVGYQYFFAPPAPVEAPAATPAQPENVEPQSRETAPGATAGRIDEASAPPDDAPAAADVDVGGAAISAAQRTTTTLETARYRMVLDNRGGRVTSLQLVDFESDMGGPLELVVAEPGQEPVGFLTLGSPSRPDTAAVVNEALHQMTIDGVEPRATYRVERPVEVRWQWADGAGWSVDKRLTVSPDGYLSDLAVRIESPERDALFLLLGPGLEQNADTTRAGLYLMSGAVLFDGSSVEHIVAGDLDAPETRLAEVLWGGIQSPYFAALVVPQAQFEVYLSVPPAAEEPDDAAANEGAEAADTGAPGTLAAFGLAIPDGVPIGLPLYLGPKDYDLLAAEGYGLQRAVDYGIFRILARPVAVTLDTLYDFTGNYGLAIILATFGVRLIFFPLSQSSMKSMRKMQQLQPQMNAIRNKYKGVKDVQKRQEMNTEVMQLYKDNGVSPLGGCLPMVLQMPVLFGFYAAISVSIGIRHAPFGLWIQDLSKMDPYYVLPLLMGASMYGQQRMSPGTGDPMQQRIFRLMPVMFTIFFLTFPSGLVIYWLVNTVLGIAQQAYVNHQLEAAGETSAAAPKSKKKKSGAKGAASKRKKRGKKK